MSTISSIPAQDPEEVSRLPSGPRRSISSESARTVAVFQTAIADLQAQNQILSENNAALRQQITNTESRFTDLLATSNQALTAQADLISTLRESVSALRAELDATKATLNGTISELRQEFQGHRHSIYHPDKYYAGYCHSTAPIEAGPQVPRPLSADDCKVQ